MVEFEIHSCLCGRTFGNRGGLTTHEGGCRLTKKRLADSLDDARDVLEDHKRQRRDALMAFIPHNTPLERASNSAAEVTWPASGSETAMNAPVSPILVPSTRQYSNHYRI